MCGMDRTIPAAGLPVLRGPREGAARVAAAGAGPVDGVPPARRLRLRRARETGKKKPFLSRGTHVFPPLL